MSTFYELVFYGELVPGVEAAQVKRNIAELFKASVEQVERMFSGQRVVIRNKLDAETAQKYVLAMQKRGAVCKVETTGGSTPMPAAEEPLSAAKAPAQELPVTQKSAIFSPATTAKAPDRREHLAKVGRLPIAGEKVEGILENLNLTMAPIGQRLSDAQHVQAQVFEHLDELELAPPGTILQDEREELPVCLPDISHLKME